MIHLSYFIYFLLPVIKRSIILVLMSSCIIAYSPISQAAGCSPTNSSGQIAFGSISSLDVKHTRQSTSINDMGLNCGGGLLSILAVTGWIKAHFTTANNGYLKNQSGDSIPYSIFMTADYQKEIASNDTINYYDASILGLLGIGNSNSASLPLYLKSNTGNFNLKAGIYTDTITVNWNWKVCRGISLLFICILGYSEGTTSWVGNITIEVVNDCMITAPDINFGAAPLASSFRPVTQVMTIYCTKDTPYSVGLSDGYHADGTQRRLEFNGRYLNYEIYQGNTHTLRWGSLGGERRSSNSADVNPGMGSGVSSSTQGFIYQAIILPGQSTPPEGVYTDTVIVDVAF